MGIRISHILEDWKNYLSKSEATKATAMERAGICAACPDARHGKLPAFIKDLLGWPYGQLFFRRRHRIP